MKGLLALLAGASAALGLAWVYENRRSVRDMAGDVSEAAQRAGSTVTQAMELDLNECSREDLVAIGLSEDLAERVIENRPYRNKLDLISRLVVPEDVFEAVKHSVMVDSRSADEPIKIAS